MEKLNKKPLIIWDFDGVLSDSEKLWLQVWRQLLKDEKDIILTPEQELKWLVGIADQEKKTNLEQFLPSLTLDHDFMNKIDQGEKAAAKLMEPMPGVEAILSDNFFEQCIATGATKTQLKWKMTDLKWLKKYIPIRDIFTVDRVAHGKPAPDLFLLALQEKGYDADQAIVVEDSIHGMKAAKDAGIKCVAFVGAEGNDTREYRQKCLDAGVIGVCPTMPELHKFLHKIFK